MDIFPLKSMVIFFFMEKYDFFMVSLSKPPILYEDAVVKVSEPF